MRLSTEEKEAILKSVQLKDPSARVFIYGSRANDELKGGDIDLLVLSDKLEFKDKIDLLILIKEKIGEQKIDLSIKSKEEVQKDPFFKQIISQSVELLA